MFWCSPVTRLRRRVRHRYQSQRTILLTGITRPTHLERIRPAKNFPFYELIRGAMVHDHTIAMRYKLIDSNNNAISLIKILLLLGLVVRFTLGKKTSLGFFKTISGKSKHPGWSFCIAFCCCSWRWRPDVALQFPWLWKATPLVRNFYLKIASAWCSFSFVEFYRTLS